MTEREDLTYTINAQAATIAEIRNYFKELLEAKDAQLLELQATIAKLKEILKKCCFCGVNKPCHVCKSLEEIENGK